MNHETMVIEIHCNIRKAEMKGCNIGIGQDITVANIWKRLTSMDGTAFASLEPGREAGIVETAKAG